MKKILLGIGFLLLGFTLQTANVFAVHVNGYYRSNGTYVQSYERTAPDGNPYNNYGYPGNYNPNTGSITGGSAETYLNNYYNKSSGSTYYSGSSYSYPSTPTCPLNSYYDGISSCTCDYGYINSGGSCVSANSVCWNQLGYSSSYNSLDNTCECDPGYVIGSSGQCVSGSSYCSSKIGIMSSYNSYTKKCECMAGYTFDGSSCVYDSPSYGNAAAAYASTYSCPVNSHENPNDPTTCLCNSGYSINSTKTACVLSPTPIATTCTSTQILRNGVCLSHTQDCQLAFGMNVVGSAGPSGNSTCSCSAGYQWNAGKTSCLKIY